MMNRTKQQEVSLMGVFDDGIPGVDLKCDFPARDSFREGLLVRLLALDEQEIKAVAGTGLPEDDLEIRELSDNQMELLAAARGDIPIPEDMLGR